MKTIWIIVFIFLFFSFAFFGSLAYTSYNEKKMLEKELYNHILTISESKANRVGSFLDERKNDLTFLSNSIFVLDILENGSQDFSKLNNFQKNNHYLDIILLDIEGNVLYTLNRDLIGKNINDLTYNNTPLNSLFNKVRKDFGVGIYDPGYFGNEELSIFVTSPVLIESKNISGKKEMIGIIALKIDNLEVKNRIEEDVGFNEIGEIYLVNRGGTLLTPFKNDEIKKIETKMKKDCFIDYQNYYLKKDGYEIEPIKKYGIYENPYQEKVFGTHQYILQTGWCVLVEVNYDSFYSKFVNDKIRENYVWYFTFTFILFTLIFSVIKLIKLENGA